MYKKTNKLSINTKKSLKKNQHYKIKNMSGGAKVPTMDELKDTFEKLYNYGFKLTYDGAGAPGAPGAAAGTGTETMLSWTLQVTELGEDYITPDQKKLEAAAIRAIYKRENSGSEITEEVKLNDTINHLER